MMAGIYRCILLLIVGLFFSSLSYAKNTEIPSYEEGISLFDVEAILQPNGVLDIKENIHFQARNQQIKHGFYRDLPRLWMQPDGDAALLNYHIVGVIRDGIPEPWHLDWHIGLMSIVVGDKQRFLPQGDYHYQIHYQVKNAILREGDSDLLIWNVTGNHWPFEIYKTLFHSSCLILRVIHLAKSISLLEKRATHIEMAASLRTEELNLAIRFIVKISRSSTAGLTHYLVMPRLHKRRIFSVIFFYPQRHRC